MWGALAMVEWDVEEREKGALSFGAQHFPSPLHNGTLEGSSGVGSSTRLCLFLAVGPWTDDLI